MNCFSSKLSHCSPVGHLGITLGELLISIDLNSFSGAQEKSPSLKGVELEVYRGKHQDKVSRRKSVKEGSSFHHMFSCVYSVYSEYTLRHFHLLWGGGGYCRLGDCTEIF